MEIKPFLYEEFFNLLLSLALPNPGPVSPSASSLLPGVQSPSGTLPSPVLCLLIVAVHVREGIF